VDDTDVLVIGSQAILGSYDEDDLPLSSTMSMEADIAFLHDPARAKADLVEGAIGELSGFHSEFGYYAEGVDVSTAILPRGWRDRIATWSLESSSPATPWFVEKHDLAVTKLLAGRPKDFDFVGALVEKQLQDIDILLGRFEILPSEAHPLAAQRARAWVAARRTD
jgi:hypothetical protein